MSRNFAFQTTARRGRFSTRRSRAAITRNVGLNFHREVARKVKDRYPCRRFNARGVCIIPSDIVCILKIHRPSREEESPPLPAARWTRFVRRGRRSGGPRIRRRNFLRLARSSGLTRGQIFTRDAASDFLRFSLFLFASFRLAFVLNAALLFAERPKCLWPRLERGKPRIKRDSAAAYTALEIVPRISIIFVVEASNDGGGLGRRDRGCSKFCLADVCVHDSSILGSTRLSPLPFHFLRFLLRSCVHAYACCLSACFDERRVQFFDSTFVN